MEARGISVKQQVPASRKLGEADARGIAKQASRIVVAKGKKLQTFGGRGSKITVNAELVAAMLGATGNLRAPLIRVGKTVVVGFNDEVYAELFG